MGLGAEGTPTPGLMVIKVDPDAALIAGGVGMTQGVVTKQDTVWSRELACVDEPPYGKHSYLIGCKISMFSSFLTSLFWWLGGPRGGKSLMTIE